MNYYTSTISPSLAEKLKEKGMLIANVVDSITGEKSCRYTYAHIFDWLVEKGVRIYILKHATHDVWRPQMNNMNIGSYCDTWHEAANEAIEKALTLI